MSFNKTRGTPINWPGYAFYSESKKKRIFAFQTK